ncbi:hypothetical protein CK203_027761 [Vitis vinifera]|uniref:Uncharacterized protein n=1 Tax=Vitis vinifera TaxID=29760 RepID=A0A438IGS9_VITVI|nr:hypothetical protein CK203_027761 [Vitis vinifera]
MDGIRFLPQVQKFIDNQLHKFECSPWVEDILLLEYTWSGWTLAGTEVSSLQGEQGYPGGHRIDWKDAGHPGTKDKRSVSTQRATREGVPNNQPLRLWLRCRGVGWGDPSRAIQ